ncbi:hypothetical protein HMPREF9413_5310 [Paenibacillus sp. HGF7]|nr:hypothetical protein HMPREF9413_5310 [Paenibacillus sp. HGF7]
MAKNLALSKASFFQLIFCFNRIALPLPSPAKRSFLQKTAPHDAELPDFHPFFGYICCK